MKEDWMPLESRWPEMTSSHLEEARQAAHEEIIGIQTQLGDKNREVDGRRLTISEHNEWRQKAKYALMKKREVYTRLLSFIKQRNRIEGETNTDRRVIMAALIAREASAEEILSMDRRKQIELMNRCNEAAVQITDGSHRRQP
jgi:hypothetical protein